MTEKTINYLLFFLLASFWSGSFSAIKETVNTVPPFFAAMLRVGLALLFLTALCFLLKKHRSIHCSYPWRIWIIGLFALGFPFLFLFWGEQYISPGLAGILNGTVPMWTLLFSAMSRKTRNFSPWSYVGILPSLSGILIIFWPSLRFSQTPHQLLGSVSILLMAMSYSIANLLNQRILSSPIKVSFYANIYHQLAAGFVFLLLVSLCFESWPSITLLCHTSPRFWVASLYMGLFSTTLAWLIYYYLIREWDAVRASTVLYIVPIMAILWDFVFFHHRPLWTEGLGIIAILLGLTLIQHPKKHLP